MDSIVNVGAFRALTRAMGPGNRACLWVQGCPFRCKGCGSPQHLSHEPHQLVSVQEICQWITKAMREKRIEGISFSGGEPFAQATALATIAAYARSLGLSTLSWTGYTLEGLRSIRAPIEADSLLQNLDVLIDGPFVQGLTSPELPLRGSLNQRIHLLTNRYSPKAFERSHLECRNLDGILEVIGVADYEEVKTILALLL
ncbi:MAG: Anaerobic ribonucleoside-triphosphate reductase-activating protein [Candidatus Uhrbacteria bacterium GW2011_GWE2_40_58]|nr:MAG: Anaerobic ribonucleoside-triphosphate reductase-activating protein [Candidatus Uhrbacteria bacterium GW2011_GWF2_40_263]KKR66875.1 MAG: Anaerobic ribonucleoside-triphosphate reductase-activating protein [Candidatus Uhrbacteria bacterium GW2011_GWE2_40_58]OGL93823.1 MAG: hypothetical protein A2239_03965 [Candidatus Uhrbacteria bacterium RIFOXYA2_FULL_40_9]OGL97985.1 MAG: hypothetical protein A2332_00595 [Candidatus Uhrbacteria bacterium RIFOXYB2_FULL_41_18]HBK35241.1 radical SAM protein 